MNAFDDRHDIPEPAESSLPPHDELDALLRAWHRENADRAVAGRERLMASIRAERAAAGTPALRMAGELGGEALGKDRAAVAATAGWTGGAFDAMRRFLMSPYSRAAACLMLLAALLVLFVPFPQSTATADDGLVMVPDGGRLDAVDAEGRLLGAVPLEHTAVRIEVTGPFARVALRQTYRNPYLRPIEAVYTFPMSHRAAVDRMTMTVGDRVIEGEVRERNAARRIYETARHEGHVAGLLEQERPNVFTQSVANIEPGATVEIEIAYIELVPSRDGEHELSFPMTVAPRFVPGAPTGAPPPWLGDMPRRHGVVLRGPATIEPVAGDGEDGTAISSEALARRLHMAVPVETDAAEIARVPERAATVFRAIYADGAVEIGAIDATGLGVIAGRAFRCPPLPEPLPEPIPGPRPGPPQHPVPPGTGFAGPTDQVPDAHLVTPQPVRPPMRAGHDVSIEVVLDTGGPELISLESALHRVTRTDEAPNRARLALERQREIPNRDFVLRWRTESETVTESVFTHFSPDDGGFVTVVLAPPARVDHDAVPPRELIFVLDSSGSMNGFPMEKSKALMERAIASMRPTDTFNIITFAGATRVLWPSPKPASPENVAEAQSMLASLRSGGGTQMMQAIEAALAPDLAGRMTADDLANLPADGRRVEIVVPMTALHQEGDTVVLRSERGIVIPLRLGLHLPTVLQPEGVDMRLSGRWITEQGERIFAVERGAFAEPKAVAPMRLAVFLTDGLVANEAAIIDAVRRNARTTRVFVLGIGHSVNRSLIEQMALAGRGESETILLADAADAAVNRLLRRLNTPVLTDIEVRFEGLEVTDLVTGIPSSSPDLLPDLFEERPLILHGRYTTSGRGAIHVRGRTADGIWETKRPVTLPGQDDEADAPFAPSALPALWARSTVDQILAPHLAAQQLGATPFDVRQRIVALGERHRIATPFTSFVAVERSRTIIGGRPMTVAIPIEMAEGMEWEGVFGERRRVARRLVERGGLRESDIIITRPGRRLDPAPGSAAPPPTPPPPPPAASAGSAVADEITFPWQRGREESERGVARSEIASASRADALGAPGRRPVRDPISAPPGFPGAAPAAGSGGGGGGGFGGGAPGGTFGRLADPTEREKGGDRDQRRSTTGVVEYPEDWEGLSLRRDYAQGFARFRSEAVSGGPEMEVLAEAAGRAERVTLGVGMASDTSVSHAIDDLVAASVHAVARQGDHLTAGEASERIAVVVRERMIDREVNGEVIVGIHDGRLIVVGDELAQIEAERALDDARHGLQIPPVGHLPRTEELEAQIDAERGDRDRLEARLRHIGRRLEPALFAAVVERLDPDAEVVDRDALRALVGNADVPSANESVIVSVQIDERFTLTDGARLDALRAAGLRIVATVDRMPGVVGEIAVESLADLAEVDGVRRIGRADPRPPRR